MKGIARTELLPEALHPAPRVAFRHGSDDRRLGTWLSEQQELRAGGFAVIGFPSDVGVLRNGGRPGAAGGPDAIRSALYRLTPDPRVGAAFVELLKRSVDLGNVRMEERDEESGREDPLLIAQMHLGAVVAKVLEVGGIPIVLGGGHETAYGHFLGVVKALDSFSVVNWDAHTDVRELIDGRGHSGSPFRQAIESRDWGSPHYVAAGVCPATVSSEHAEFVKANGALHYLGDIDLPEGWGQLLSRQPGSVMLSLDLDSVRGSDAPGVSAPSADGLTPREWYGIAEAAGRNDRVVSIDVVELNPLYDVDNRTARLAAHTVWSFIRGLSEKTA